MSTRVGIIASALALLVTPLASSDASANLILVTYDSTYVVGNDVRGGPKWTGQIDTIANTITFLTWEEVLGSVEFFTPSWAPNLGAGETAWVWKATKTNADGSRVDYNLPDTMTAADFLQLIAQPVSQRDFGFVSTQSAHQLSWLQLQSNGQWLPTDPFPHMTQHGYDASPYPGWGGYGEYTNEVNSVLKFYVGNDDPAIQVGGFRLMLRLPSAINGVGNQDGGVITAIDLPQSDPDGGGAAVPEASACLFALAAAIVGGGISARRRRR